jgi:hypothetical protein
MVLTAEQQEIFMGLACRLSPENLSGDGEYSRAEVTRRLAAIRLEWARAERAVGRKVTEDEVWANYRRGNQR